jgi:RNA polymerase sigma factor (sigma-70 family)
LSFHKSKNRGLFGKLSDNAIIEGLRLQDDKVLNYLYDHYLPVAKNHVLRNSGSAEDVSDVFQDCMITLYQKISQDHFNLTSDLKGYFFGIVKNVWSANLRQKRRTEELTTDLPDDNTEEPHDQLFQRILSRAFVHLKPDCQKVLTLYYDGCSYEEIAEKMGLKNETYARRKKYLCKEALMEIIKDDAEYLEYQRLLK